MRKTLYAIIFFLLVVTSEIVIGKENKAKIYKTNDKHNSNQGKYIIDRIKRSLDDEEDKPFWANRGKKKIENANNKYDSDIDRATKLLKRSDDLDKGPFWGMRGRRESSSDENKMDDYNLDYPKDSVCKNCYGTIHYDASDKNYKDRRQEGVEPFWGNRGRRGSDLDEASDPFWGNRGRRQDNEPFWGTRGRRKASSLWDSHGRIEDEPFWGTRGRRDDEPFWGNRGRRQDSDPFWGNRGRRQDSEPFWGNRGRRDDVPFWGNRGRRKEDSDDFLDSDPEYKKEDLKDSILNAMAVVGNDIEHLSQLKRSDQNSFWFNRGRNSKIKHLFDLPVRNTLRRQHGRSTDMNIDPSTVLDNRMYAEEPHFIVVERSSRSSAESEDPFYISRGKKYYVNYNLVKAARDRRGAIEEIVKSVRNDPYYIARGKKDTDLLVKLQSKLNATSAEEFMKAKELICSAIDLITSQHKNSVVKREIDSDRERRTILKKLAAQLQVDPYYVSRGKKSVENLNDEREFITEIVKNCT